MYGTKIRDGTPKFANEIISSNSVSGQQVECAITTDGTVGVIGKILG